MSNTMENRDAEPVAETLGQTNQLTLDIGTDAETNLPEAPASPIGTENAPHLTALPLPTTTAAKEFHKIRLQEQRTSCAQLHAFLSSV